MTSRSGTSIIVGADGGADGRAERQVDKVDAHLVEAVRRDALGHLRRVVAEHLRRWKLGAPAVPAEKRTVKAVLREVLGFQGHKLLGPRASAMEQLAQMMGGADGDAGGDSNGGDGGAAIRILYIRNTESITLIHKNVVIEQ